MDIASFPAGETADLLGSVRCLAQTIEAPLTGRKCVYYHLEVVELRHGFAVPLIHREESVDFLVEDSTGCARINSRGASFRVFEPTSSESGGFDRPTTAEELLLTSAGVKSKRWIGVHKTIHYLEYVLEPGQTVALRGCGQWAHGTDSQRPRILVVTASPKVPLYITDDPRRLDDVARDPTGE